MSPTPTDANLRESPRRPFGVYVIVGLLILGVIGAALEIARVQMGALEGLAADADEVLTGLIGPVGLTARLFRETGIVTASNSVIIAIWVIVIVGLWTLQRWAWVTLMILTGLTLTYALVRYLEGEPNYISMAINVAAAFYLNDNSVQRAFARRRPESAPLTR
jgi:hypothetical protein